LVRYAFCTSVSSRDATVIRNYTDAPQRAAAASGGGAACTEDTWQLSNKTWEG